MPPNLARMIVLALIVGIVVLIVFAAGWADDRAPTGSKGRAVVTQSRPAP